MDVDCLMPGLAHVAICRRRPDQVDDYVQAGLATREWLERNLPFEIVCDLCGAQFIRYAWRRPESARLDRPDRRGEASAA
jgi:hypothetical protein